MDEQLRALQRESLACPSPANEVRYLRALVEAGSLPPRSLEIAAALGSEAARLILGPPAHFLVADDGRQAALPVGREIQLGRRKPQAEFAINHPTVCRQHCKIKIEEGHSALIWDTKSIDGTHVNGKPVTIRRARLNSGDEVRVGGVVLRYLAQGAYLQGLSVNRHPKPVVSCAGHRARPGLPESEFEVTRWIADLGTEAALRGALAAAEAVMPGWLERFPQDTWAPALIAASQEWSRAPSTDCLSRIQSLLEDDPLFEASPVGGYPRLDPSLKSQDAWAYKEGRTFELDACIAIRALAVLAMADREDLAYELQQGLDGAASAKKGVTEVQDSLLRSLVPWLLADSSGRPS